MASIIKQSFNVSINKWKAQKDDAYIVERLLTTFYRFGIKKYEYNSLTDICIMLSELYEEREKRRYAK